MKGMPSRSRNSVQKEREPFNAGPYRPKMASPGRRPRVNGENVPPDGSVNVRPLYQKHLTHFFQFALLSLCSLNPRCILAEHLVCSTAGRNHANIY